MSTTISIWPIQIVAYLLGGVAVALLFRKRPQGDRVIAGILAVMWLWTGVGYHVLSFSSINKAAYIFAVLFILQGCYLLYAGVYRGQIGFGLRPGLPAVIGAAPSWPLCWTRPASARSAMITTNELELRDFAMKKSTCCDLVRFALKCFAVMVVVAGTNLPALAIDVLAPFGFAWGPLDKIPKPSLALKDANVTILAYRRDRLPTNELAETEVVLLDVCKKEGLQQVSWASKSLSSEEATAKLAQLLAMGVQKYGDAKPSGEGAVGWENGRTEILRVAGAGGEYRILMVNRGPDFEACAAEHDSASDQKLRTRWMRRIDFPN